VIPTQNRSQQVSVGLLHFFPSPIEFITNTGHRRPVFVLLPLAFSISQYILGPLLFLLSLFIILIVLLQRGRGGGLAGALGGAGGSSALGVKAGDIFTRITAVAVLIWIVLCAFVCWYYLEPPPDIAVDPSSDTPALTVGPKAGSANVSPLDPNAAGNEAKSEVVSPAVPVLPVPGEPAKTTEEAKPATEEAKPATEEAKPATETPQASGSGTEATGTAAGSTGDGK
jgi:preprotein translocase subunit SecG